MEQLKLSGLAKQYGKTNVVDSLDLEVEAGELLTLLGPSGCGKTTTLRMLAGFIEPDAGTIRLGDQALSRPGWALAPNRRRMGMVFQNYAVWPHMTVSENVAFGLRMRRTGKEERERRTRDALEMVDLAAFGERYPSQLSGGQQQRVALARALITEPAVLLLDEPLSNLDAGLRERMRGQLRSLQRRTGITFVYVTHDQVEALSISDRVAVLNSGRIEQCGTPEELYERPRTLFVAQFMGTVTTLTGTVTSVSDGVGIIVDVAGDTWRASVPTVPPKNGSEVTAVIRPEAVSIHAAGTGPTGAVRGRVTSFVYAGSTLQYRIEVPSVELTVVRAAGEERFDVGTDVEVVARPSGAYILEEV